MHETYTLTSPILHMRKLRYREVKKLAQYHTVKGRQDSANGFTSLISRTGAACVPLSPFSCLKTRTCCRSPDNHLGTMRCTETSALLCHPCWHLWISCYMRKITPYWFNPPESGFLLLVTLTNMPNNHGNKLPLIECLL